MKLEDLKAKATASELVLIERVVELVRQEMAAPPDWRAMLRRALEKTPPPDHFHGFSMRGAAREWVDAVIRNIPGTP